MSCQSSPSSSLPPKCELVGKVFQRGGFTYKSDRAIWKTEMSDYTILTDEDFTNYVMYAPKSLKERIKQRWLYNMHIGQSFSSTITSQHLNQRVRGGEILAYKYAECVIEGNQAVYCGYIPTIKQVDPTGVHNTCRFSLQEIYPRKLYVYLARRVGRCVCSFDKKLGERTAAITSTTTTSDHLTPPPKNIECTRWLVKLYDGVDRAYCSKSIDWSNVYVFMGEPDTNCKEFMKIPRDCPVCAQCYKCSVGGFYCRTHVVCKHKRAKIFVGENSSLAALINKPKPRMKRCQKIKS